MLLDNFQQFERDVRGIFLSLLRQFAELFCDYAPERDGMTIAAQRLWNFLRFRTGMRLIF